MQLWFVSKIRNSTKRAPFCEHWSRRNRRVSGCGEYSKKRVFQESFETLVGRSQWNYIDREGAGS